MYVHKNLQNHFWYLVKKCTSDYISQPGMLCDAPALAVVCAEGNSKFLCFYKQILLATDHFNAVH